MKYTKTLLVLAASRYQVPVIKAAKRAGYRVITTDNVTANPGHRLADACYSVDTIDHEGVMELARHEAVNGVIAAATDVAVPTQAYVAQQLCLPGPPLESTEILCDKLAFRQYLKAHGFPTPMAMSCGKKSEPAQQMFANGPCILKPGRSSGSKGIFIVHSRKDFRHYLPETLRFSSGGKVLLESYIDGFQGTVEGVIEDGELALAFFLDRQTWVPPYVATVGHRVPTKLHWQQRSRAEEQLRELWRLLGVTEGPFDCDFVATEDEVYVLEMSPRIGGNSISRLLHFASGFDLDEYGVRQACGDPFSLPSSVALRPTALVLLGVGKSGAMQYDTAQAESLRCSKWVVSLDFDVRIGQHVRPFINGQHRLGEAIVHAEDRERVDIRADDLLTRLALKAV